MMKFKQYLNEAKQKVYVDDDYLYPRGKIEVQADVFGDWAVHKTTGKPNKYHAWSVSHIPSGKLVSTFQKSMEAKEGAKKLSVSVKKKNSKGDPDFMTGAKMVLQGFGPEPALKIDSPSAPSTIDTYFGQQMKVNKKVWAYFVKEAQKRKADFIKRFEKQGLPKKSSGMGDDMFIDHIFKTVGELVMKTYKYKHMRAHSTAQSYGQPVPIDPAASREWIKIGGALDRGTPLGDLDAESPIDRIH